MTKNSKLPLITHLNANTICSGCGTCAGVCPEKVLKMEMTAEGMYRPKMVENDCRECSLCTAVCPIINENVEYMNQFIFNKTTNNPIMGTFIDCYKGYSTNSLIRWQATSGGMITSLLLFLLEEQLIEGALLTKISKDNPLQAEPFIARTEKEILSAMGSKYVPVPLNQLLNQVLSENGRFAVVGLPCHIQGIRRAEYKIKNLRNRIIYHFGLTCSHTLSYYGIEHILDAIGISADKIVELKYRGDGWPGGIKVSLNDGEQKFLPNQSTLWSDFFGGYFFTPFCCTVCHDNLNEFADVSFADAWLPEILKRDNKGTSIVITRTEVGEKLIQRAASRNKINVFPLEPHKVVQSQLWPLFFKKRNIVARVRLLKMLGRYVPPDLNNNNRFLKATLWDYIVAPVPYINIFISKNKLLRRILKYVPFKLLDLYRRKFIQLLLVDAEKSIRTLKGVEIAAKKKIKIVVTNSHANNRGDEAAQRSMIDSLRKLVPNAEFTVLTTSPEGLQLQEDVRILWTFSARMKTAPFIILWAVLRSLGIRLPTFSKKPFEALKEMANANLIISAPGGPYFGDLYKSDEIQEHLLHILLAKILKKPVMIYAPSMGPFESHRRNIIRRYILNKVEIITLRDHISKAYLEDLKLTYPLVYLTADSAFQDSLDINKDHIKEIMIAEKIIDGQEDLTNKFLVGITPAGVDWNYRGSINPEEKQERYNRIIAKAIDYLIDKFNAKIVFFPQLYGNSDDVSLISEIIRLVQKKDAIRVLSKKWDSEVQQAIISQMDVVVGNRYHSVIFALKAEIPTVCIAYEHKSTGVMKAAKLDDFVININELTYELLTHKISQAWNQNEEIRRILKSNMPRIRRLSFANSVLAKALIRYAKSSDIRREELKKEVEQLMHDFSN